MGDGGPAAPTGRAARKHGSGWGLLKELPVLVAIALLITLLLKAFVVQAFYIKMQSMEPTLHQGNRVLVSELHYRIGNPHRGDVVIFRDPRMSCETQDEPGCPHGVVGHALSWIAEAFGLPSASRQDLVKRVVALPGETVAMHDGNVFVCATPGCQPIAADGTPKDGHEITFASSPTSGPQNDHDTIAAYAVPAGRYYVLGDNRANSSDSRVFGSIDRHTIVGRAFVVIWPPSRFRRL